MGCEFWPTVTFNPVYSVFDFTAVVANASAAAAEIQVERDGAAVASVTVQPGELGKIYLPWISELKGGDFDQCTNGGRPTGSIRVDGGAYHLKSSVPVTVWQFNPLEYEAGSGGPAGKDWTCPHPPSACNGNGVECLSVSNDASLLIPATAMREVYRLFGKSGTNTGSTPDTDRDAPGSFAITATADETTVRVQLAANAHVQAGAGVPAAAGGSELSFTLNAGDVVQLLGTRGMFWGDAHSDLSGSLVVADKPVQVIATVAITNIPTPEVENKGYADHLEETVLPAEALGDHYIVAPPTTALGKVVGHYVRFYGNVDGTALSYPGGPPAGAPALLDASQTVEIGPIDAPFEIQANHEFAVGSLMLGGQVQDPSNPPDPLGTRGDPSFSLMVAVAQFRRHYTFLAPTDYDVSYADIVLPVGARVALDGRALSGEQVPIGTRWLLVRERLDAGASGVHELISDLPVGLQVMGFGHATSYYYPGGLNLKRIAPPPLTVD